MKKIVLVLTSLAVVISVAACLVYIKVKTAHLNQALCVAASQDDTAAVERLLKRGASPNALGVVPAPNCDCDTDRLPALCLAVDPPAKACVEQMGPVAEPYHEEAMDTVAVLLRAGADVNARAEDGFAALTLARSSRMVKFLLAHGAKVDLRDKNGCTALMRYADSSCLDEMHVLIKAGADVNARNSHGKTVLMSALDGPSDPSNVGAAKTLIAAGADVNARDNQGKTALRYALESEDRGSIRFLKKIGARQ